MATILTDAEILKIMNAAIKEMYREDIQDIRKNKIRSAKVDFCNLDATDYCKFQD